MTLFLRSIASLGSLFLISCLAHEEVVQLPTTPRPQDGDPDQTKVEIEDLPDGGKRMVVSNQCSTDIHATFLTHYAYRLHQEYDELFLVRKPGFQYPCPRETTYKIEEPVSDTRFLKIPCLEGYFRAVLEGRCVSKGELNE
ncbi:MAG: hypothetical protein HYT77_10420 [Deltaproteobacteria bacterium]|nr:hypothetical protein [Deltaproteobacteria bacterium]